MFMIINIVYTLLGKMLMIQCINIHDALDVGILCAKNCCDAQSNNVKIIKIARYVVWIIKEKKKRERERECMTTDAYVTL